MTQIEKQNPAAFPANPKEAVAYWDNLASQFARATIAAQVMCGFSLIELKQEMGIKRGGNRKSGSNPKDSGLIPWADFVKETYNFSEDTAASRIHMAEGVKADFKKLGLADRFRALLQTHPSQWSEPDIKLLSQSLAKCTDGMTQADFFQKLGLAKKPSGNPDADGDGSRKLSAAEQAEKLKKEAIAFSGHMGNAVRASNRNFFLTDDLELNSQVALLEAALKLRHAWLAMPKGKRDVGVIEKMLKEKI